MKKPNYQFEKRQRELEKKKKKAEKADRKIVPEGEEQVTESATPAVTDPEQG